MSTVCRSDPLQKLVNKEVQPRRWAFQSEVGSSKGFSKTRENQFLEEPTSSNVPGVPLIDVRQNSGYEGDRVGSEEWVKEFGKVSVKDDMEFNSHYKKLYAKYESGSIHDGAVTPVNRTMNPMGINGTFNRLPVVLQQQYENMEVLRQPDFETDEQMDAKFAQEFEELERQLDIDSNGMSEFDPNQNQYQFQNIASEVIEMCSNTGHLSDAVNRKLSNSKFMALMRRVGDGEVTLKYENQDTQEKELYSVENGETVGHTFQDIQDTIGDV